MCMYTFHQQVKKYILGSVLVYLTIQVSPIIYVKTAGKRPLKLGQMPI